jgi:NitT/TauT family transport system permease protein
MSTASTTTAIRESSRVSVTEEVAAEQVRVRAEAAARRARHRQLVWAIRLISLAIVLVAWQLGGARIDPVLFTTPSAVAVAGYQMIVSGELWSYLWPSLVVLVVGLAISAVLGIGVGLLLARFWVADVAVDMYITFLYSTPTVALVPLIVLWVGFESTAKIVILFLFAFFPLVINTYQGVKNVDPRLMEVGRAFRCSERQLWTNIILPAALPFIVTGLRLAVGRGLIGMVLADLYTAISGIGYLITRSASTYRVDKMFVPIVVLGILGITLTALLRGSERWIAPWTATGGD